MNILFISKYKWPHIGGVEKHIRYLSKELKKDNFDIKIISGDDIRYPKIKILGLFYIWYWLLKNRSLILNSDIIHIHDVFIWYLPFKFIFPTKKVFVTFHGWEGKYPIPMYNIVNKKIASKLSNGSISVGKYIEKYYKIKSDFIIYGGVEKLNKQKFKKIKNTICYLGRLEKDTGLLEFLKWIENSNKNYKVIFTGDGSLKDKCKKLGSVVGNVRDVNKYLKSIETVVPSGYLSYLEAKNNNCKIMTFANNPLKVDYWKEIKMLQNIPTWGQAANVYSKLWKM